MLRTDTTRVMRAIRLTLDSGLGLQVENLAHNRLIVNTIIYELLPRIIRELVRLSWRSLRKEDRGKLRLVWPTLQSECGTNHLRTLPFQTMKRVHQSFTVLDRDIDK